MISTERGKPEGGLSILRERNSKATTASALDIDVRVLQRKGLFSIGYTTVLTWDICGKSVVRINASPLPNGVRLAFQRELNGAVWAQGQQQVEIEPTACTFGGRRYWFRCPIRTCAARVAKLYLSNHDRVACRRCSGLSYESQRESKNLRATRRADRIRERLGWGAGILNGHKFMPRGMHGRTFRRLVDQHDGYVRAALDMHMKWAERMGRRALRSS